MTTTQDIDKLVSALSTIIPGGSDLWPLKPSQIFPYIDADQSIDLLNKLSDLKKRKVSKEEVALKIKRPSIIRHLFSNVLCTGLKVARKLKIGEVKQKDKIDLVKYFIDILKLLAPTDPFCEGGVNKIHSKKDIDFYLNNLFWKNSEETNVNTVNNLLVDLVAYIWAFYWPYFPSGGYEAYGPYDVSEKYGKNTSLVIKDFYNLSPFEVWPYVGTSPYKSIRVFQVYNTKDIYLTFSNRIISKENLPSVNKFLAVTINERNVGDISEITSVNKLLEHVYKQQTDLVNGLSNLEKVKRGAMLSYYMLKDFYLGYWDNWFPEKDVERTLENLGSKFVDSGKDLKDRSPEELFRLFDPRNNYIP